ncbi:MAG TPA: hypothetical protein VGB67_05675 [Fibrella sp.]|jgi:hypothetical protein
MIWVRSLIIGLFVCLVCQNCFSQEVKGVEFLQEYYALSKQYTVWDDTVHSFEGAGISDDSVGQYHFFRSTSILQQGDSLKLSTIIGNVAEVVNPISEKVEMRFTSCNPYVEMSKSKNDTCWHGIYGSEGTGTCNAVMTISDDGIRIAGIAKNEPFVFFARYKRVKPKPEIVAAVKAYLGN